jgi:tuftelin-interacting protein 11
MRDVIFPDSQLPTMARRKRMDDSDSSAASENEFGFDNDPDAREERALFEDPYQRKRRRRNGKEDALYGIFGEESDEESAGKKGGGKPKKSDWTKAPAFVSGDKKVDLDEEMEMDKDAISDDDEAANGEDVGSEGEVEEVEEEEYSDDSEPSRPPSPRIREEDEESEKPRLGGIGLGASKPDVLLPSFSKGGIGSSKANRPAIDDDLNSFSATRGSKGGIGSRSTASTSTSYPAEEELPSSFGNRSQRFFVRDANPSPKPAVPMTAAEMAHFSKLQGSFGARMLSKMGWQAGTGLGTTGEGIVTPIESKLRPQKMGIAFKGFKEKTEQSKQEARRRGEVVSDDEDAKAKKFRKKVKEQEEKRSDVWKRPKKVKTKIEHKTYEQIVAEAGVEVPAAGIGQIIDATGAVACPLSQIYLLILTAIFSLAKYHHWLTYR